jgi:DnaJ-class molecular chaperone
MFKSTCIKCGGNGLTYHKSLQSGPYSLRCNHCNGTGIAWDRERIEIGVSVLVISIIIVATILTKGF